MTTSKKNFLLEFTDVTEAETNGIIKHVRDPHENKQIAITTFMPWC